MITLLKVTISGPPGSGTSTLVAKIAESRGWRSMNGAVEELSAEAKEDTDVDRHLDELLQKRMSSPESPEIVESREGTAHSKEGRGRFLRLSPTFPAETGR